MQIKSPKFIILLCVSAIIIIAVIVLSAFWYSKSAEQDNNTPSSSSSQLERAVEVPANWKLFEAKNDGYWLYYSPDWTADSALMEAKEIKGFIIGDPSSPDGIIFIRAITDPAQGSLEYLDNNFAKAFREQAVSGTLYDEKVTVQERESLSLEAQVTNVTTNEQVDANLLLMSAKDNKPAYAISAILKNGAQHDKLLNDAKIMVLSLRFF